MNTSVEKTQDNKSLVHFVALNSLMSHTERQLVDIDWVQGQTLDVYLGDLGGEWLVNVMGKSVDQEDWSSISLQPGDYVVAAPNLRGGDTGKNILRLVAIAVISFYTFGAGGLGAKIGTETIFGTIGATASTGQIIAATALMVGGQMAVAALLPPSAFKTSSDASPTYSITGPKNTSTAGVPVPLCYGGHGMAGNIVASYIENATEYDQNVYMLINAGEGIIDGISDIKINDQPMANFKRAQRIVKVGSDNQSSIGWFNKIITPRSWNLSPEDKNTWHIFGTTNPAEQLRLDINFPGGLADPSSKGGTDYEPQGLSIQVSPQGQNSWTGFGAQTQNQNYFNGIPTNVGPDYSKSLFTWRKRTKKGFSVSITSKELPLANYDVRVKIQYNAAITGDPINGLTISDLNEIVFETIGYNHTALLGLKIAVDQDITSIPKITFYNQGMLIDVFDETTQLWTSQPSDNPAWIAWDLFTNTRYGGGIPDNRMNLMEFREWAQYCEEKDLTFNGVFDKGETLWDVIGIVYRAGRSAPIRQGTRWSVNTQRPKEASMLFNTGNIIQGSLNLSWLSKEDRANDLDITFSDMNEDYRQRTITVYDEASHARGIPPRKAQMTVVGKQEEEKVMREGISALNMNRLVQMATWRSPLAAIGCTIGDVVLVQHDLPQWGFGGHLLTGSTSSALNLDIEVTIENGKNYGVMVSFDKVVVQTGLVTDTNNDAEIIWLNNFDSTASLSAKVLVIDETEFVVEDVAFDPIGVRHGVSVFGPITSALVGESYNFYDTDVVIESTVANSLGDHSTLTLFEPMTRNGVEVIPGPNSLWSFGEIEKITKPFSILSISNDSSFEREISALEYIEDIYDDTIVGFLPTHSSLTYKLGPVTVLDGNIEEELVESGLGYESRLVIAWSHDSNDYRRAEVYYRVKDGEWQYFGTEVSRASIPVLPGNTYQIRIVPVDSNDLRSDIEAQPIYQWDVLGVEPNSPPAPINLVILSRIRENELRWYTEEESGPGDFERLGHFEIWCAAITGAAPNPTVEDALLVATTTANYYVHENRNPNSQYKYWIRSFDPARPSTSYSIWHPSEAGLTVTTQTDTDFGILWPSGLEDSNLATDLASRIDLIDVSGSGGTGLVTGLSQELIDRAGADGNLQQQIDSLSANSVVEFFNQDEPPVDADAEGGVLLVGSVWYDTNDGNKTYRFIVDSWVDVSDQRILDNAAAVTVEQTARADADGALAGDISTLATTVNDPLTGVVASATAVGGLQTLTTSQGVTINAQSGDITDLGTLVNHPTTGVAANTTAVGGLQTLTSTQGDSITSQGTDITELQTTVNDPATGVGASATAISGLQTLTSNQGDSISSQGTEISTLESTVDNPLTGVSASAAAIGELETLTSSQGESITSQATAIEGLETTVNNETTGVDATAASLSTLTTTVANIGDSQSASATEIGQIQAVVGDDYAVLQTIREVTVDEGGLSSSFQLKTDVDGYISGFGLINNGPGEDSEFIINADHFGISHSTTPDIFPFQVVDGATYIDGAFIKTASIGNASIGNTIQSTGYSDSTAGWQLKKDFGFTLRGAAGAIQMQVQTGGGTQFGADISNSQQTYAAITGTKPPANAAVNAPSIGVKINHISFADANIGELYIHGFNAEGQADDVPGYISYNGEQISIQGRILTGTVNSTGFLMYDPDPVDLTGYVRPYLVNSDNENKIFAKKEGHQWSYDNNYSWVPFTPSATALVFGDAITATQDVVASANAWGYGRSPASIVDPFATKGANSSNLAVGSGVNLVANASFDEGLQNLSFLENGPVTIALDYNLDWTLENGHTIYVRQLPADPDPDDQTNIQFGQGTDTAAVTIGERLEASLYVGAHRCSASLLMIWLNSTGGYLSSTLIEIINPDEAMGGRTIDGYKRMGGFITVPNIGALRYGTLVLQKQGTEPGETGSFVFATRPMLARAFPNQTELSEWNPGTSKTNWVNIPDRPDASALLNNEQTFLEIQGDKPHIDAEPNARLDSNLLQVFAPLGAAYSNSNTQTGAIVVFLPQLWSNTMLMFEIANFGYGFGASSKSFVATVGGYNSSSRGDWYKTSAKIQGYIGGNNRVRFGTNGTKAVVVIGDDDSTWSYPKIAVKNLQAGYSNYGVDQWKDGWDIDIVSDLSGYTLYGGNNDFSDALLDAQAAESSIIVEGEASYRYYGYGFGNSAATTALGGLRDNDGVDLGGFGGASRSYILHVYNRTSEAWVSHTSYDVYGTSALATQLATDINAHDSTKILVVTGQYAPAQNRLLGGLPAALYNIGGSRTVFEREDWGTNHPTYFLAGVPGLGEGNGIEHFSKGMGLLDVTFYIKKGSLVGTNYTPDFTPGADVTSANTAAGFAGQGNLAVLNSIVYESGYISGAKPPSDAEANVGPNLILNAELGGPKTPASSTTSQSVEGWAHYTSNASQSYVKNATGSEVPPWGKNNQRVFHTAITANFSGATGRWMSAVSIPIDITKNYNLSGWFRSVSGNSRVYFRLKCFTASGSAATTQYLWTLSGTTVAPTWTYYDKAFGPQGEMNFSSDTVYAFVQVYIGYTQISVTQGAGFVLNEGLTPQKIDATEKFALSYLSTVDYSSGFISGTKPPSNADNTGSNTALNIAGQGALATESLVTTALIDSAATSAIQAGTTAANVGLGNVTDGADVTGSNTALNIVGQGNFATLNSITTGNISTYIAGAAIGNAQIGTAAIGTLQIENNQTIFVPKLVAFNSAQHILQCYIANVTFFQFIPHTVTTFSFANAMSQTSVMLNVRLNGSLSAAGDIINWRVTMLRKINSGAYVKIGNISDLSPSNGNYEFDVWYTDNPGAGTISYAIGVELTGGPNFQLFNGGNLTTNFSGQIVLMGGKR